MDFNNPIGFMDQQLKALKELEDLLAHNEKQDQNHNIAPEDIEALRKYVADMKLAAETAKKLAEHYKNAAGNTQPATTTTTTKAADTGAAEKEEEKPKKKRSTANKPEAQKEEPVKEDAGQPVEDEFDFLN